MTVDILVPPLSQTADTLVIVAWLKQVGDPVTKGEILFTVETDKAVLEVESPASGILSAVLAEAGAEVKVKSIIGGIAEPGEVLMVVEPGGETLPPERQNRLFASPRARQLALLKGVPLADLQGKGTGPGGLIVARDVAAYLEAQRASPKVTPLARRMAETAGVDLSQVVPAKPGGAITKADIQSSVNEGLGAPVPPSIPAISEPASPQTPAISAAQVVRLSPTRATIARRMTQSHQTTAPVTYQREADTTRLVKLRKRILKKLTEGTIRPTYTDFLVYMTCRALARHPALNATFDGERLELYESVHMSMAVDSERGLIVPVIREADSKGIADIAWERSRLVEQVLGGTIDPDGLVGGTFTITNLGTLGIDHFTPIINPPQVAILGVGRIREVPAIRKGKIRTRKMLGLSLTCDHRVIDGAPAARFLQELCSLIENPDLIWL